MAKEKVYKKEGNDLVIETVEIGRRTKDSLLEDKDRIEKQLIEINFLLGKCELLGVKTYDELKTEQINK